MNFVFVGPLYVRPSERDLMDQAQRTPNMHWLGGRRLEQLPGYIDGADVLMLPYRLDDENVPLIGLALKFYEYMISGKPICATPYTCFETDARDLITVAKGPDAWAKALDRCVAERGHDLAGRREALARQNTYAERIEQQRTLLAVASGPRETVDGAPR
jgi:glycosyltransferase involved in cell wall biosynthesis